MCQSFLDIDEQIEQQRNLLRSTTDLTEVERIYQRVAQLYRDRVRMHQSSDR